MVRNIAGFLIEVGGGTCRRGVPPGCSPRATAGSRRPPRRPRGCTCARSSIRRRSCCPGRASGVRRAIRYDRRSPDREAARHVVVREDHAVAHQDRAAHAFGPRGPVDQVPGLRLGALSRRARAQPQRLPQVQPPHAHRRARAAAAPARRRQGSRSAPACSPRIRCASRTASATRTGWHAAQKGTGERRDGRDGRPQSTASTWWPVRSSSSSSAARWARWSASASGARSSMRSSIGPRWCASPRVAARACRRRCCRCCRWPRPAPRWRALRRSTCLSFPC
jgi:hypothetical protein